MSNIISKLESLLFLSGEPISVSRLAKVLSEKESDVQNALDTLSEKYLTSAESGLLLVRHKNAARLTTKPENAPVIETLTKSTLQESLSKAALEVLTIIAYRAPITRAEIESIRGVNCSFTLRNLLLRGLTEREGNPSDARGYIYQPSFRFLETLGLQGISSLPDYETLSQDERLEVVLEENPKTTESTS